MKRERSTACLSRRHWLATSGFGLGGLALASLLQQEVRSEEDKPILAPQTYDLKPKSPKQPARAKAMISMFMQGGPSHLDMFDRKPELQKRHMTPFEGEIKYDNAAESSAKLFYGPWKWARHGQCGMELSELLPGLATVADDITLIRSMHTDVNNHGQSINAMNTGKVTDGRPSLGSWLTYGLGSESQNLPAYVVLTDPGGLPVLGTDLWTNGFLPSIFQGSVIRPQEPRIQDLDPPPELAGDPQAAMLRYLAGVNTRLSQSLPGETDLDARIASYELAARMQSAAREALDLSQETEATKTLYGLDAEESREFGTRCLIARRLVERGVRYVQIFTSTQQWDHHGGIINALPATCKKIDRPSAALVADLKRLGMLDETVVHWGGEMGRLPVIQNEANIGRDHNTYGFSMWVAGGGFRSGYVHGETDEFGHRAVVDPISHVDYQATLLHLFGLEHESLSFRRPNGPASLVDQQECRVATELLR